MRHAVAVLLGVCLFTAPTFAHPTGAPLATFPVQPCRILDTRVAAPLPTGTAYDGFARGSALSSAWGAAQADCGIPAAAEAVTFNVTVLSPTTAGYLKINGTGSVTSPNGPYARIVFAALQSISNEVTVDLCNVYLFPAEHEPCPYTEEEPDLFSDFQILPQMGTGGTVHVVIDVVNYLARFE